MTQSELARRVKVTQGAIAKIVSNNPGGSAHLHKIARELGTTAEYLTGETDDPEAGAPAEVPLDYYQRELLECVEMMTPLDRKTLLQLARSLSGRTDPKGYEGLTSTVHAPRTSFRSDPNQGGDGG